MSINQKRAAQFLRTVNGKRFFRIPVHVQNVNTQSRNFVTRSGWTTVIADSPAAAANYIRDLILERASIDAANTTIRAYGPRGGITKRFIGFESAIAHSMFNGCDRDRGQGQLEVWK